MKNQILCIDVLEGLKGLKDESVQCCVTSPPYWGLRDYGVDGQLGLEKTPEEHVEKMVKIFREVRRVLRKDGTLWLNYGDSYVSGPSGNIEFKEKPLDRQTTAKTDICYGGNKPKINYSNGGLKPKDLVGMPWRVALALQADGWYLRSDIIWHKPNPMPESCTDRPTKSHEYIFLMTKSPKYFYDADSIREKPITDYPTSETKRGKSWHNHDADMTRGATQSTIKRDGIDRGHVNHPNGRNKRTVWTVTTKPYPEAHFATFPPDLIKPCILAGTSEEGCCSKCGSPLERVFEKKNYGRWDRGIGNNSDSTKVHEKKTAGTYEPPKTIGWKPTCDCKAPTTGCLVLDPFMGSGTTAWVAYEYGRKYVGFEINPDYVKLAEKRLSQMNIFGESA